MGRHCCVKGCTTGVNLPSHIFPKDVILMNKWKKAINSENIQGLTDEQLRKCVVCYKHFADNDYEAMYRLRRLKPGVIPSLYLPSHGNNNSETNNDNDSETSNSKNNIYSKTDSEQNIEITIEPKLEITGDTVIEKSEIIEIMEKEQSSTEEQFLIEEQSLSQSTNNLLNRYHTISNLSELKPQESRISELKHLESPRSPEPNIQESIFSESQLPESPKSESSSSKSSTCCLLELHNLLQGKYFHKFTPKIWKLYKLCCILKKKQEVVAKRQLSFRERIRQAKQYGKSPAIEKLLSSLTPIQRTFLQIQVKTTKYAPKDRCFTLDEKIAALSIMKQCSKCYQYLTHVFNLPSIRTLQYILQKINIHPGPIIFINRRLKRRVKSMKEKDKICVLMWDEMLLQPHLDYDMRKKHILGFEDFGKIRRASFADHALVFMVRGIQNGWKFPLTYYLCDGAAKTNQLIEWIKIVAKIIIDSGLHLVAFICNDKKRNIMAVNKLKLESANQKLKRGEFYYGDITINEQDIIPLYDPPHLIKSVRNSLLNNDLEFDYIEKEEQKFASWEIIEQAYHMDLTHNVYRLMPKITAEHIIRNKIKRKKIKNATQVLSATMGGFIYHHTKLEGCVNTINGLLKMPKKRGQDTAEIVFFFDQLFDSVNGYTLKPEKLLRVAVSHNSSHFKFWGMAIKKLQRMHFIDSETKTLLKDSPVLTNWIYTIKGFRKLWMILKKYDFKYLKPRILNQDSLRHFFGQIRSLSKRYSNPTCAEFESSFKTLLINNLSPRTVENNSENKIDGSLLFTLKGFIYKTESREDNDITENLQISDMEMDKKSCTIYNYINICNSIAARILNDPRIKGCDICKNLLTSTVKSDLISNERLLNMFKYADYILKQRMSDVCYMHHTALMLETELYVQMDLHWLNCQQHDIFLKQLVISYITIFYIYKWCDNINDILTEYDDPS